MLGMFSPEQIQQLIAQTSLATVRSLESVGSTNDEAKSLCADPDVKLPCLVIARLQTKGRGRGSNTWSAGEGALTFSLVHDAVRLREQLALNQRELSVVALWTALGVRAALCEVAAEAFADRLKVKWPNDIFADDRKIGGILIESVSRPAPRMVIGIGINVNNQTPATEAGGFQAIALQEVVGTEVEPFDVLLATLHQLDQVFAEPRALRDAWDPHCFLRARRVCTPNSEGVCEGVSESGALRVRTTDGIVEVRSGSVKWER